VPNTLPPSRQSASHTDEKIDEEDHHNSQKHHQLDILPPHPPPQTATTHTEVVRAAPEPISLIDQQINPFTSLKNPLNVLCHNATDAVDLPPG
jgi:hypothetical protein